MALILSIETSTKSCSVALHQDGNLLATNNLFVSQSHSVMLTSLIQNTVKSSGKELQHLDAIAVAKGPGSYTGLRIGTATAKGLCYALNKPLLAVNTLEAMAHQLTLQTIEGTHWFCPMIDARRMEVYCAIFDNSLQSVEETSARIIDETSFQDILLKQKMVFFGDGAPKCKPLLQHFENALFISDFYPNAQAVGTIATVLFQEKKWEDIAYFEPFYLKDFVNNTQLKK